MNDITISKDYYDQLVAVVEAARAFPMPRPNGRKRWEQALYKALQALEEKE